MSAMTARERALPVFSSASVIISASVFILFFGDTPRKRATSSIVFCPGVCTGSGLPSPSGLRSSTFSGVVDVERVRILHDELAHPQQSRLRTRLVAKLRLNLIPDLRKLLVAPQLLARNVGHDLFMRHAQTQVSALAVFQAKHVVAHDRPAPTLLPKIARMQRRQIELLPNLVHLLADDPHDLVDGAIPKKEKRVNASAQLTDVSRADQQLVTGNLGISRGLAQSRNKEFRPAVHSQRSQREGNCRL